MGTPTLRSQGCVDWADCFSCPFDDCRYTGLVGKTVPGVEERNATIQALRAQGVSTKSLAEKYGLGKSSIRMIAPLKKR